MAEGSRGGSPARLALLFVLAAAVPLAGFAWLGQRVLQQQADLDQERQQSRVLNSATLLARELDRNLANWEAAAGMALTSTGGESEPLPAGAALFVLGASGLVRAEGVPLPYYPAIETPARNHAAVFAAAHQAEFRARDDEAAARAYRILTRDGNPQVRAAALVGFARCSARLGRTRDALEAYDRLAVLRRIEVGGAPAELQAHRERLRLFEKSGDRRQAERERTWLSAALSQGRLPIDRATYDEFTATLELTVSPPAASVALAHAAMSLWSEWMRRPDGRAGIISGGMPIIAAWRRGSPGAAVILGPLKTAASTLQPLADSLHVTFDLDTGSGASHTTGTPVSPSSVERSLREAGLPWTLRVAARPEPQVAWLSGQQMFGLAVGFMTLVVAGASYAVFRSMVRDKVVAQLQTDFVAAVSHEFRTPLAAVRHLADMLETGAPSSEQQLEYSRAIGRESRRLHALVENLLDFGRIEEGRRYEMADVDLVALAQEVADDCADRAAASGHVIRVAGPGGAAPVRADREAVGLALRNLIDNAIKYSPGAQAVDVRVSAGRGTVAIAIQDYGVGVSAREQRAVFSKFVRGSAAESLMVKGTGIGLAMADRIVRAHGGSIMLESEPGHGSTFTMSFPQPHA